MNGEREERTEREGRVGRERGGEREREEKHPQLYWKFGVVAMWLLKLAGAELWPPVIALSTLPVFWGCRVNQLVLYHNFLPFGASSC